MINKNYLKNKILKKNNKKIKVKFKLMSQKKGKKKK